MQRREFSSTWREVRGFVMGLRALLRSRPELVAGPSVQIITDSQAAYEDCWRMRGTRTVFVAVCELHLLAWEHGIRLAFAWQPRSSAVMREADALSKPEDDGDWLFSRKIAREQIFAPYGEQPELDYFASACAHMCRPFFARRFDGKCAAVDGLLQSWSTLPRCAPQQPAAPHRPLCWVFPPAALLTAALAKPARERPEAWLVCPRNLRPAQRVLLGSLAPSGSRAGRGAAHSGAQRDGEGDAKRVGEGARMGVKVSAAGGADRGGCGAQTTP